MSKDWFQWRREVVFIVAAGAAVGAACGGTKTTPGVTGAAGSAGASGWTYLPPGNDAGTATSAGSGGTGSGGTAGAAGSSGAGGSVAAPTPFGCNQLRPNQAGITDFDAFTQDRWTGPSNVQGGVYIYPEPLRLKAGDFLRYSEQVATYSGMGVWFAGCIDASTMKGVRFSMAGDTGVTKSVQFYLIVNRNRDIDTKNVVGACAPDEPADPWSSCRPPVVKLAVTAEPTTHTVLWTDLAGGLPTDKTDGSDILALQWTFDWAPGVPSYHAELTIDDLSFVPAGDQGDGGAGGAGGAGGDGAGGSPDAGAGGSPDASAGGAGGAGAP